MDIVALLSYYLHIAQAIQNGEPDAILSWDVGGGFIDTFKAIFGDPDRQATARHKLALLKQGAKPAEQFIIDFEILESEANLGDGALTEHFKKGLQPRLVERIFGLETLPTTLREWKDYARRFDRHHRQFLEWQSQSHNSSASPRPFFRTTFYPRRFQYGQAQQNIQRPRPYPIPPATTRTPDVSPWRLIVLGAWEAPKVLGH